MSEKRRAELGGLRQMTRIPSPEWKQLSPTEKIERLLSRSLDEVNELLEIPLSECDAPLLSARMQAIRVIVTVSARMGIERRRSVDWAAYMKALDREAAALGPAKEKRVRRKVGG